MREEEGGRRRREEDGGGASRPPQPPSPPLQCRAVSWNVIRCATCNEVALAAPWNEVALSAPWNGSGRSAGDPANMLPTQLWYIYYILPDGDLDGKDMEGWGGWAHCPTGSWMGGHGVVGVGVLGWVTGST